MFFWNKFCGLAAIFLISSICTMAQQSNTNKIFLQKYNETQNSFPVKTINASHQIIPSDYYTKHFGIMCKQELAIEKATKIPFRFRLGSLQQCNYLEGKK